MLTDLRLAWRALRRAPGFLAAAVLTLALGVGVTTALFGVVDAVLFKPLPYRDPERLVRVWPDRTTAKAVYAAFRERSRSFESLAGYEFAAPASVLVGREPARVTAAAVTGNLFGTLGVRAALGRAIRPGDDVPGAEPVAVLSDGFWRERYGADPGAVGRVLSVEGVRRRIVGVMPPSFRLPEPRVAVWTPAQLDPARFADYWWIWRLFVVGRLAPGVTAEGAVAELRPLAVRSGREFPMPMANDWGRDVAVVPMQEATVGSARGTLLLLLGAVLVVLVVAVVNVTGLALVRAAGRAREVTVRAAVGASRARLARQLVAEGVVVAAAAGLLGTAVAWAITRALVAVLPGTVPRAEEIGLDARALGFALAAALVAGVASAAVPALRAARVDLRTALGDGMRGSTRGGGRRALEGLVVAQVTLAVVLAAGAGLLATSLARLRAVDPGFRAEHVTVAEVPLPVRAPAARADVTPAAAAAADSAARTRALAFHDALLARARTLPGVRAAALAAAVPFDGYGGVTSVVDIQDHPTPPGAQRPGVRLTAVSPGLFATLGVRLLAGRDFADADRDGAAAVAVVDSAAVRQYWPELRTVSDALGRRVKYVYSKDEWMTVVGVAASVRGDSLSAAPVATIYTPVAQARFPEAVRVVVRGDAGAAALAPALRRAVSEIDRTVPLGAVRELTALVDDSAARPRFVAGVLTAFAAAAVLLGAVGVYGVVAFAVASRAREVGVRSALGATPGMIRTMVLRDGGRLAAAGVALGLLAAVAGGRAAQAALFGVRAAEPLVLAGVAALLLAVALLASLLPARRAARVSPLAAMRAE